MDRKSTVSTQKAAAMQRFDNAPWKLWRILEPALPVAFKRVYGRNIHREASDA